MAAFDQDIANRRDEDEIQLPWPEFPFKEIEEWFGLKPDQNIYYYLKKIFNMKVIYMMKKEYEGQSFIVQPWPEVPFMDIENWLEIHTGELIGYMPSGINKVSCVTIASVEEKKEKKF